MNRRNLFRSLGLAAAVGAIAALPKLPAKASDEPKIIAQPHVEPARVGQAVAGRSYTITASNGANGLVLNPSVYPWTIGTASNIIITSAAGANAVTLPIVYSVT